LGVVRVGARIEEATLTRRPNEEPDFRSSVGDLITRFRLADLGLGRFRGLEGNAKTLLGAFRTDGGYGFNRFIAEPVLGLSLCVLVEFERLGSYFYRTVRFLGAKVLFYDARAGAATSIDSALVCMGFLEEKYLGDRAVALFNIY
jgi:hypothetical protein